MPSVALREGGLRVNTKTGSYTYYVTIPETHIDALGWRERQRVMVLKSGNKLVIKDWKGASGFPR